jgi:Flp pilus assembly protein TadD
MEQDLKKQRQETPVQALGRLRRVAKLAPQDPELRLALARALVDNSLIEEAIDQIQYVIAMSPNHLDARKLLETALQLPLLRHS